MMGLLDNLLGAVNSAGGQPAQTNDPKTMLMQAALSMLTSGAQGENAGGLSGLLSQFQNTGLGDLVKSWIGNDQNQTVSADQVQQALGGGQLEQLAQASGLSKEETAGHLSEILPELINKLTPNGQIPEMSGGLGAVAGMLSGLLGSKNPT
ncbi:YidB family protein [Glaciimonas sp. GG7]